MIPLWVTRLVQVFPPREVVDFDVPQVPRLGVYGGFGELVFKGQQLLWTGHALLCLREHPDQPITGGGGEGERVIMTKSLRDKKNKLFISNMCECDSRHS